VIHHLLHARTTGAVRATEELAAGLHAMADDLAATVGARRRQPMDRALEAVEYVSGTGHLHLEGALILVSADLAFRHDRPAVREMVHPEASAMPPFPGSKRGAGVTAAAAWCMRAELPFGRPVALSPAFGEADLPHVPCKICGIACKIYRNAFPSAL
jgi:hypothetical protein